MGIIKLIKLLYANLLDTRDERDAVYTMLGLVTKIEKDDRVRLDLKIRYDGTEIEKTHDKELLAFEKFVPANRAMATFMFYEKRGEVVVPTGRFIFVPLMSITSVEMTGRCLDQKGDIRTVKPSTEIFSHN